MSEDHDAWVAGGLSVAVLMLCGVIGWSLGTQHSWDERCRKNGGIPESHICYVVAR